MTVDDCYRELGVRPDASDAEIKAAWRKLAARWHPDRNPSPQALRKTQRINQALEEIRRARREEQADDQTAQDTHDPADEATPDQTAQDAACAVVDVDIGLTLEEVATGCVRMLTGQHTRACTACAGSGRQPHATDCPDCTGSGRTAQPMWFAWMAPGSACPACEGRGSVHAVCTDCDGTGQVRCSWHARVALPPGLRAGSTVDAMAEVADGALPVRLRLTIGIQPHAVFTADADGTLHCSMPVDGFAWTAERWTDVPTATGLQQMRLRRGSLKYRVKGGGLPWQADGSASDCLVAVTPLFPAELDRAQQAAIDTLVAGNTGDASSEAGRRMADWLARVQDWEHRLRAAPRD